jgi:hypothetical protein
VTVPLSERITERKAEASFRTPKWLLCDPMPLVGLRVIP